MNFLKKKKFPKIGNIFVNQTIFDEYSARIYKIDPFSMSMTKKKYKLTKMEVNAYYLELMFILLNIF